MRHYVAVAGKYRAAIPKFLAVRSNLTQAKQDLCAALNSSPEGVIGQGLEVIGLDHIVPVNSTYFGVDYCIISPCDCTNGHKIDIEPFSLLEKR